MSSEQARTGAVATKGKFLVAEREREREEGIYAWSFGLVFPVLIPQSVKRMAMTDKFRSGLESIWIRGRKETWEVSRDTRRGRGHRLLATHGCGRRYSSSVGIHVTRVSGKRSRRYRDDKSLRTTGVTSSNDDEPGTRGMMIASRYIPAECFSR